MTEYRIENKDIGIYIFFNYSCLQSENRKFEIVI